MNFIYTYHRCKVEKEHLEDIQKNSRTTQNRVQCMPLQAEPEESIVRLEK